MNTHSNTLAQYLPIGAGFCADAYDIFVINVVVDIMSHIYPVDIWTKTLVKVSTLGGVVIGQTLFGIIADIYGRKNVFIVTCILTILGSLISSIAIDFDNFSIYNWLMISRFLLGIGVGGEYPLSASIMTEISEDSTKIKIRNLCITFSMKGVGQVLSGLVLISTTQLISDSDLQWRLALGFGAVPMAVAFYYRWNMDETLSFKSISLRENTKRKMQISMYRDKHSSIRNKHNTATVSTSLISNPFKNSETITQTSPHFLTTDAIASYNSINESVSNEIDKNQSVKMKTWESLHKFRFVMIGTAGSWFLLDLVYYANGLFSGSITRTMGLPNSSRSEAIQIFILQIIAIPGYICSIKWMNSIGCKKLQAIGFLNIMGLFALMAIFQWHMQKYGYLYLVMYGLTFFAECFGPHVSTYVIPSIIYPTESRATCHGISAAFGKLGAIVGTLSFLHLKNSLCDGECDPQTNSNAIYGMRILFAICSIIALMGFLITKLFIVD